MLFRLGAETVALQQTSAYRWARVGDQALAWHLRRNCSVTPRQLALLYAGLSAVSLTIGVGFWMMGATLVLGFAGLELVAVGAAFLIYARHAADGETVSLQGERLIVERKCAGRRERLEFCSSPVRHHLDPALAAGWRRSAPVRTAKSQSLTPPAAFAPTDHAPALHAHSPPLGPTAGAQ